LRSLISAYAIFEEERSFISEYAGVLNKTPGNKILGRPILLSMAVRLFDSTALSNLRT